MRVIVTGIRLLSESLLNLRRRGKQRGSLLQISLVAKQGRLQEKV